MYCHGIFRPMFRLGPLTMAAIALMACSDTPTAPAVADLTALPQVTSRSSDAIWAQIIEGRSGPGTFYNIFVPHDWNGKVVYYARGFADAANPVAPPDNVGPIAEAVGERGFAIAYSSYRENGFAVKSSIQSTHQLRGLFTSATRLKPTRSYIIGKSLGAAAAVALAEDFKSQYDGVLPMCGMVGGSLVQTQYLGHVRTLFDALFPGVLPGSTMWMPPNIDPLTQIVLPAQAAVFGQPGGVAKLVSMAMSPQTPLPTNAFNNYPLMFESLYTALSYHARGINDINDHVNGATSFGNANTVYTSAAWDAATQASVNAIIGRYTMDQSAINYLTRYWMPSGDLKMPTLTLYNQYDPAVPSFHETALLAAVTSAGKSDLLVQMAAASPFGHCDFPASEVAMALDKLVLWVEQGIKP
jgi:hypothetical protein